MHCTCKSCSYCASPWPAGRTAVPVAAVMLLACLTHARHVAARISCLRARTHQHNRQDCSLRTNAIGSLAHPGSPPGPWNNHHPHSSPAAAASAVLPAHAPAQSLPSAAGMSQTARTQRQHDHGQQHDQEQAHACAQVTRAWLMPMPGNMRSAWPAAPPTATHHSRSTVPQPQPNQHRGCPGAQDTQQSTHHPCTPCQTHGAR